MNSLILGVLSCLVSAVIGTLGAVGLSRIHWKSKGAGIHFHIAVNDTGDHPWYGADGILLYAEPALWHADIVNRSYGILCALYSDGSEGKTGGNGPCVGRGGKGSGCGAVSGFPDITLPLIMPAVISGSLLAFAMSMDDVVISIFVNGPRLSTLPIKVYTQLKTGVTPEINALCTILLAATLVIFIVYSLITKKKK